VVNKKIIRKKILILGSFAVGKTSLVSQYLTGFFSEKYLSTIGVNIKTKTIETEEVILNLIIWDIADIVTHQSIPDSYLETSHGILLVYDLTRPETFNRILEEHKGFLEKAPNLTKIVIGNKKDLIENMQTFEKNKDLYELTDIYTSAKTGENVNKAFEILAHTFLEKI